MFKRNDKVWFKYNDVTAYDAETAQFAADYIKRIKVKQAYLNCMEIVDLQAYKHITQPKKIRKALQERDEIPFIFSLYKN